MTYYSCPECGERAGFADELIDGARQLRTGPKCYRTDHHNRRRVRRMNREENR